LERNQGRTPGAVLETCGMISMAEEILQSKDLTKHYSLKGAGFSTRKGVVAAVDGISLSIKRGEVFGLVGESGCGKSTLGRVLLRLEAPTAGRVMFEGKDLAAFDRKRLKQFRRRAQIIYQDPYSSLNPRKKIAKLIEEPLIIHGIGTAYERRERVAWLLEVVGLLPEQGSRYPHEFSGGQRQRIVIARALALNPHLILADEPVSALDVSIRAQIINLLKELQGKFNLTYVFISHDLSVVEYIADRVGVMYLGRMVETAPKIEFYLNPLHPYSQALLSAAPVPDPKAKRRRIILAGDVPSPIHPPPGCPFHPRCWERKRRCSEELPRLKEVSAGHWVACFL
jgi:oligopeptide/dipeptide ABC transporter ATP-binding protein